MKVMCTTDGDPQTSGCVTFWRLSGSIDVTRLVEAWDDRGWDGDLLPSMPSEHVALRRAVMNLYQRNGALVRPVRGDKTTAVLDMSLDTSGERAKPVYTTRFIAWMDEDGMPQTEPQLELEDRSDLFREFSAVGSRIEEELSAWFARIVFHFGGVALRDSGGVYFVPKGEGEFTWEKFAELISEVSSCKVYRIPAMDTETATQAIIDSLIDEVNKAQEAMGEALDARDFGKRALRTRVERVHTMIAKVSRYEAIFSKSLESVHSGLASLEARVAEALLVAEEEEAA